MTLPKVQIRDDILETLICSECHCYLSCGPVRLKITGGLVCGRCLLPDNSFVVDVPYENVAKMLLFPCRNNKYGCNVVDGFDDIKVHEENCEYKEYTCPLVADGSCEWKGPQKDIFNHGKEAHEDKVLSYPCLIPHVFTNSNIKTFLTAIDDLIFLIHVKVCLATRKIYHCVRFVGDNNCALYFEFILNMDSNSQTSKLMKSKSVVPYSTFEVEESNSIVTSITGLQEILGDLQNISFVITIKNLFDILRCIKCHKIIKKFVYKSSSGYKCENCVPVSEKCSNCDYKDYKPKIVKHQKYFCRNKQSCSKISPTIDLKNPLTIISATSTLPEDVSDVYPDFFHETGSFFKTRIENFPNKFSNVGMKTIHAIKHDFGYVLCEFYKFKQVLDSNVVIYFSVYAPVPSEELNLYDCHIVISRPDKNFKFEGFLEKEVEFEADWTIKIDYFHYYDSCHEVDIKINFVPRDIYKHPKSVTNNNDSK